MLTTRDRHALLLEVFGGYDKAWVILGRIELEGRPTTVSAEIVRHLSTFGQVTPGREALGIFLEEVLKNMGGGEDADKPARIHRIADRFIEARLLLASGERDETIEISHEALVRAWDTFTKRYWVANN